LGLTLVRQLAGLHGGQVQAASPGPGKGSTFTLRLPITNDGGRQALPSPATSAATPRRILVVEDEPPVAQALELVLKSLGHTVRVVGDGKSAESAVAEFQPEGVLVDVGLPDMDGYDVARRLRAAFPDMALTLIALTGYGRPEDVARAEAAGFDRHLLKPASAAQLYKALAAIPRHGG
ncbi:MAG: response regulator, partial [Pseudomonadota bacterium]|nr:response regulator [Pseudomonadota bacterium]